jgi:hypothetical protein
VALALCGVALHAAEPPITISDTWARATPPGAANAAAYLRVANTGPDDVLLGVRTAAAREAQLHTHVADGGAMRMTRLDAVPLQRGAIVEFAPGGLHIMLLGIAAPLAPGDSFLLTLQFRDAGDVDVAVAVRDGRAAPQRREAE